VNSPETNLSNIISKDNPAKYKLLLAPAIWVGNGISHIAVLSALKKPKSVAEAWHEYRESPVIAQYLLLTENLIPFII